MAAPERDAAGAGAVADARPVARAASSTRARVDDEVRALIAEWDRLQAESADAARALAAPAARPDAIEPRARRIAALRRHRTGTRLLAVAAVAQAAVGSLALAGTSFAQPVATLAPEASSPAQPRQASRFDAATARLLALMGMPQEDGADLADEGEGATAVASSAPADGDRASEPSRAWVGLDALPVGPAQPGEPPAVALADAPTAGADADTDVGGTERAGTGAAGATLTGPAGPTPVPLGALASTAPSGGGGTSATTSAATGAAEGGAADEMGARLGGVVLAASTLDEYRGGFENSDHGNALRVRFSIERAIYVNGDLVATRVVGMDGLTAIDPLPLGSLMRGYGNAATAAAAAAAAAPSMPASALVIQNNLNDQQLRSQTAINAVVESSHLLRATRLDSIMRDVSASSLAR